VVETAAGAEVAGTAVAGAAAGAQAASSMVATSKAVKILDFFNMLYILYSFRKLVKIVQTNKISLTTGTGYPGTRYMR
jgi:hypothetical protein